MFKKEKTVRERDGSSTMFAGRSNLTIGEERKKKDIRYGNREKKREEGGKVWGG